MLCRLTRPHYVALSGEHREALAEAVRDSELWPLWYTAISAPEAMAAEIDCHLGHQTASSMLPFTVLDGSGGRPGGMATYINIDVAGLRVEIGSTWLC